MEVRASPYELVGDTVQSIWGRAVRYYLPRIVTKQKGLHRFISSLCLWTILLPSNIFGKAHKKTQSACWDWVSYWWFMSFYIQIERLLKMIQLLSLQEYWHMGLNMILVKKLWVSWFTDITLRSLQLHLFFNSSSPCVLFHPNNCIPKKLLYTFSPDIKIRNKKYAIKSIKIHSQCFNLENMHAFKCHIVGLII